MGAFGEKLRRQREQRGVELEAISKTTKISVRMLRALEEEHFDQLPGGVFNKGFVRAYARHVGLDEEEAVSDYLAALRESQVQELAIMPDFRATGRKADESAVANTSTSKRADRGFARRTASIDQHVTRDHDLTRLSGRQSERGNGDRRGDENHFSSLDSAMLETESSPGEKTQIAWGKLLLALVVVTALLGAWNVVRHRRPAESRPQAALKQSAAASAGESTPPRTTTESAENSQGQPSTPPAHTAPTKSAVANSLQPVTPSSGAGITKSSEAAAAASSSRASAAVGVSSANNSGKPAANAVSDAAEKPPASFSLLIRAEETTWIAVTADGKTVAQETLIAPAHTSVRATGEIVVRAGNAAGIRFEMNGKEIPTEGNEAEVKTYVFDANGLRSAGVDFSPKQ